MERVWFRRCAAFCKACFVGSYYTENSIAAAEKTTKKNANKTHPYSLLQEPTTQLAKMSIDLKFVELTADVLEIFFIK